MSRAERRAKVRNDEAAVIARQLPRSKLDSNDRFNLLGKARRALTAHEAGTGSLDENVLDDLKKAVALVDAENAWARNLPDEDEYFEG